MKKFEYFEVTADIAFKAYGKNLNEAFENAGLAIFNIISDTNYINPTKEISFEISKPLWLALFNNFKDLPPGAAQASKIISFSLIESVCDGSMADGSWI